MRRFRYLLLAGLALAPLPLHAEVAASSEAGFVSHNEVLVRASPADAWAMMLRPGEWWNDEHTYSGDAANMTISAKAGQCFCELVPATGGEVEHMRVIYVAPETTLRMVGGLGPLQAEAVTAVLTMALKPDGEMTRISWDYVVGGYARTPMRDYAPLVDKVVGEQLLRLAARLGTVVDPAPSRGR